MDIVIGTQLYPWSQYYSAKGKNVDENLDECLSMIKSAGLDVIEHTIETEAKAQTLGRLLKKHRLEMPTMYAMGTFHTQQWAKDFEAVVNQARWGKQLGVKCVVVNPNPIDWNNPVDKTEEEIRVQAHAMLQLTEVLKSIGLSLAYHTHDSEMRRCARELHHMLLATRRVGMKFCLDSHWIWRGAGESQVVLDDIIELYGDRIASLHVRQSRDSVWTEALMDGDIDYYSVARKLKQIDFEGPMHLEICRENGTPQTMDIVDAHRESLEWAKRTLILN
jgi:inosose dehydratase